MEKTILMASSLNGQIARPDDATDFVSDAEWSLGFSKEIEVSDTLVLGRRTYEMLNGDGFFDDWSKKNVIVVSKTITVEAPHHSAKSVEEAVDLAKQLGSQKLLWAGGSKVNASALSAGLVDYIKFDFEPILVSQGMNFYPEGADVNLKYLGMKQLTDNLLQLHYQVN